MEISILLTIFLIIILLGRLFFQGGKIYLIGEEQIIVSSSIGFDSKNRLFHRVVKSVVKGSHLLNIVILTDFQKATQTTLIQPQIYKFKG